MDELEFKSVAQRLLMRAAYKQGSVAALAMYLQTSRGQLGVWICGTELTPSDAILKVVNLIIDEPPEFWRESADLSHHHLLLRKQSSSAG